MSVREEDSRRKNSCSNRGLTIAATAIGVGVGAALYYFFSKRPENPDTEGSTSGTWSSERPQSFNITQTSEKSDYTTISEHTTTDTSVWTTDTDETYSKKRQIKVRNRQSSESNSSTSTMDSSYDEGDESGCSCCCNSREEDTDNEYTVTDTEESETESDCSHSETEDDDSNSSYSNIDQNESLETGYLTLRSGLNSRAHHSSDSEFETEFDMSSSSEDVPTNSWSLSPYFRNLISHLTSPRLRNMTPRERRWSLEECAICFEVMLKDQPLMQLPCTHNFHVGCIGPWLREQQTCPMCRKAAE